MIAPPDITKLISSVLAARGVDNPYVVAKEVVATLQTRGFDTEIRDLAEKGYGE